MAQSALRNLQRERMDARRARIGMEPFVPQEQTNILSQFTSLDTPENMSLGATIADMLMGFAPGVGTAQGIRDFERARRDDDMLGMVLGGVGVLPIASGIVKTGKAGVKAVEKAADALDMSQLDRSTIQSSADQLASQLNNMGFKATVTHSGSKAGPSSYVQISDPQTGRFFLKPVRFSNHGKGPREAQGVISILDLEKDPQDVINVALEMRGKGKSPLVLRQEKEVELQKQGMTWKQARREAERIINQQEEK